MGEYIVCTVFWLAFTIMLCVFGMTLLEGKKSVPFCFAAGYLVYSFFVAVGGIAIQLVNLPWKIFAFYMAVLWVGIFIFCGFERKRVREKKTRRGLLNYLKEHWVLLAVCLFLCGMLFFYYNAFWYGNHLDDGYYVTKAATMPYNSTGFRTNYSVGTAQAGLDSYILNTWELEASFYIWLLGVKATLFLRLFQSAFYYFFFVNVLKLLAEQILEKVMPEAGKTEAQYVTVITLLFGGYYLFLMDTNLFFVRDMFRFNSAMFCGAGMVETLSMVLLLVFFTEVRKIDWKMIVSVAVISVVLISKSTIALPVIVIAVFAYLEISLFFEGGRKGKLAAVLLGVGYAVLGVLLPGGAGAQKEVYQYVLLAAKSPVVLLSTVMFIGSFFWKKAAVIKLNCVFLSCAGMMVIPQINDVFETFSVYAFVAGRAWSSWTYAYVMLNTIYFYLFLRRCIKRRAIPQCLYAAAGVALAVMDVAGFAAYGGELFLVGEPVGADMRYHLDVMIENHYFVPNFTIELGEELEALAEEKEGLRVVMPESVGTNGTVHNLALEIRSFAPHIVVPSAIGRYPVDEDSELYGYSQEYFNAFVEAPSEQTARELAAELERCQIDCVVVNRVECGVYLEEMGYELHGRIEAAGFEIWTKL